MSFPVLFFRASIIIVGGLLAVGCGFVTIDSSPPHTTSSEQKTRRAPLEPVDPRDPLERELLPRQLSVYGSLIDLEKAQKQLAAFKESRHKPPGDRIPGEVLLARVRADLSGVPEAKKNDALALYREARSLATDVPPWAGEDDESQLHEFAALIGTLSKLIDVSRGRAYDAIPFASKRFEEAYDDYKAKAKHGETLRARALLAEAKEIRARFEKDVERWTEAVGRLEKDVERNRLGDEQSRLENDTAVLQSKLGLTSFDTGCDKTSPDPVDRQRLAALCPKMTRLHAIIARRYAIEQRYMQGVWPDSAKRGKR